ncbi:MAG: ribonuclease R [Lachnospiraceae bacterium]|nr:ribonuclease R [Lachnospiraceae bacterium]
MNRKSYRERKQMIYDLVRTEFYVPMKEKELAIFLQVEPEDRPELKQILNELLDERAVEITKRGKYKVPENKVLEGIFIANAKGFGFVEVEGQKEDYYVPEEKVNGAFHQDRVAFRMLPPSKGRRAEVEIVEVLERGLKTIVGTFEKSNSFGFVIPDQSKIPVDIFIPTGGIHGAVSGHKVVAEISYYGDDRKKPEGNIIEILGHVNDPGVDILSIVKAYDIPESFKERTLNQAVRVAKPVSEADMAGRADLRRMKMVTIDGEDAKDLDDAVSLTVSDGLFHLGVHIADVTNYVQENSALDREALERGTSVYLVDRVIPMLPHTLSNGICSLNAGEDRLALSCLMTIDGAGNVIDYKIKESVINVDRRMSYSAVARILEEKDEALIAEYQELVPMFEQMAELSQILRLKRKSRGSVDFDFQECKIYLDPEGRPTDILPYERNVATKIIEDFMLLANETVAQHFYWLETPFVYRTHDKPDPEKVQKLSAFIHNFGYSLKLTQDEIHPKELQKLLLRIEGTQEEAMLSRLILRSMKRAQYQEVCTGHFGLACQYYCHFTSPIRRYPDLQIHRIIKESLRGRLNADRAEHYNHILPDVCVHSSKMERRADEAERETDKLKKAQYMQKRIGEEFEGMISGITSWGIYVELPNTVEGLVRVASIPGDFYVYREETYEMVGQSTGKTYKLGDKVKVFVKDVDTFLKTIDFELVEE